MRPSTNGTALEDVCELRVHQDRATPGDSDGEEAGPRKVSARAGVLGAARTESRGAAGSRDMSRRHGEGPALSSSDVSPVTSQAVQGTGCRRAGEK